MGKAIGVSTEYLAANKVSSVHLEKDGTDIVLVLINIKDRFGTTKGTTAKETRIIVLSDTEEDLFCLKEA